MPLEAAVHELLSGLVGRSVTELVAELDPRPSDVRGKSAHAIALRRLLEERGLMAGLVERGVTRRVVRRDARGDPIEKMTFRNFDHEKFPREKWASSEFRAETRRLLVVVFDSARGEQVEDSVLSGSFFWSPDEDEDRLIEHDWRRAQEAVTYRFDPPKEKDTDAVHVATKGRDADDVEEGTQGTTYRKECLAFNKKFVAKLVSAGMAVR